MHCFPPWSPPSYNTCRLCHVKDKPKINLSPKMKEEKRNWGNQGRALFSPSLLSDPFFFLVCPARLAKGEATSFPSTCLRGRWENGERTEISVTVTKGVACEGGYANTCLVDFLYNFLYFSFREEGMILQLKLYVCNSSVTPILKNFFIKETAHFQIIYPFKFITKAKSSFVSLVNIQRFYGCKLRGTFFF